MKNKRKKNVEVEYTDEELELRRIFSLNIYILSIIIFSVMLILVLNQTISFWPLLIVSIILIALVLVATKLTVDLIKYLPSNLIRECRSVFSFLTYSYGKGIPEKTYKDADFINNYTAYDSFNFIFGKLGNKEFIISDIAIKNRISTSQKMDAYALFKGAFGVIDLECDENIEMVISPDIKSKFLTNFSDNMKRVLDGSNKIEGFENQTFENCYEVYCNDKENASKIITPFFMQKMLEFRKVIKKNITLIYRKNKIYFFIENKTLVNAINLFINGATEDVAKDVTKFVNLLAEILTGIDASEKKSEESTSEK